MIDILQSYGWRKTFALIVDELNATTQYYSNGTVVKPGACRLKEAIDTISSFECAFCMSFTNACDNYLDCITNELQELDALRIDLEERKQLINAEYTNMHNFIAGELEEAASQAAAWESWKERVNLIKDRWLQIKGGQCDDYSF